MFNNNRKLKSIVLSMALAAGMLPVSVSAQNVEAETRAGLFGLGKLFSSEELFSNPDEEEPTEPWMQGNGGLFSSSDVFWNSRFGINLNPQVLSNGNFGEPEPEYPDAPLGSGIAILIGAGLGYVALKKKEDKQ